MIKKEDLKSSKKIYLTGIMSDFPMLERIPYSRYKRSIKNKLMYAYGYYVDNERIGYVVTMEGDGVVFISYLAIKKDKRAKGYGTKMIEEFTKFFEKKKYIIIEVDSPEGIKNEKELDIIKRRKDFYFKNGFEEVKGTDYSIFGVKYDLLVYKINCEKVTNKDAVEITRKLYSKIARSMRFFHLETI